LPLLFLANSAEVLHDLCDQELLTAEDAESAGEIFEELNKLRQFQ
jgi:hypothetical protein